MKMNKFRKICRWLHRELGFLAVGLTMVYAISGIALNHSHQWDPNFASHQETFFIEAPGTGPNGMVQPLVLQRLGLREPVLNTWRAGEAEFQVFMEGARYDVNLTTGEVRKEFTAKRPFWFAVNFMHLNSGQGVWTGLADALAATLLILALTGIFLVPGKQGLSGRGGIMFLLGILLPVVYVLWQRL